MNSIVERLAQLLPEEAMVTGDALAARPASYWDDAPTRGKVLVRPDSTAQLSDVLRLCHEQGQSVVVRGGVTGLVEGAESTGEDVLVSLERMNRVESVDEWDGIAVVQAGACGREGAAVSARFWRAWHGDDRRSCRHQRGRAQCSALRHDA